MRAGGLGGPRVLEDLLGVHHRVHRRVGLGVARLGAEATVLGAAARLGVDQRAHVGRVVEALPPRAPCALDQGADLDVILELAEPERFVAGDQRRHGRNARRQGGRVGGGGGAWGCLWVAGVAVGRREGGAAGPGGGGAGGAGAGEVGGRRRPNPPFTGGGCPELRGSRAGRGARGAGAEGGESVAVGCGRGAGLRHSRASPAAQRDVDIAWRGFSSPSALGVARA